MTHRPFSVDFADPVNAIGAYSTGTSMMSFLVLQCLVTYRCTWTYDTSYCHLQYLEQFHDINLTVDPNFQLREILLIYPSGKDQGFTKTKTYLQVLHQPVTIQICSSQRACSHAHYVNKLKTVYFHFQKSKSACCTVQYSTLHSNRAVGLVSGTNSNTATVLLLEFLQQRSTTIYEFFEWSRAGYFDLANNCDYA